MALSGLFTWAILPRATTQTSSPTQAPGLTSPIPMLAYYYIWYDTGSWDRAKIDYPLLGKYSSDDPSIMREHIQWAKQAGLQGFIVSWKSTDTLNRRLEALIQEADTQNFKLAIIYQGLDFDRQPLPADRIAADLDLFVSRYADDPAFDVFGKPLVIWSGTWEFSRSDIASVTQPRRDKLLILASEKNLAGYQRLSDLVDGDAYYWSSVNPDTYTGYAEKLIDLSQAIHESHGLWIAPASPGFDARLIGGKTVVDRKNGQTLKSEVATALQSSPDMVGIISWNEFSENSHIEPSQKNGDSALVTLANINHLPPPQLGEFDSSAPGQYGNDPLAGNKYLAIGGFAALVLVSLGVIYWRQSRRISIGGP